jgi:hypothetical protein
MQKRIEQWPTLDYESTGYKAGVTAVGYLPSKSDREASASVRLPTCDSHP